MLSRVNRKNDHLRSGFQYLMPTTPNLGTYLTLINHYAFRLGDLSAVARYLDDMKSLHIPLHGAVFKAIFRGFALHGGAPGSGSSWNEQRLRSIWAALLKALDDETEGLYISVWLILWALRAFDRCSSPEMVFKAYNSLASRWDPTEMQADFIITALHSLLKGRQSTSSTGSTGIEAIGVGRHHDITKTPGPRTPPPTQSVMGTLGRRAFG
jgi:hypothetical protein